MKRETRIAMSVVALGLAASGSGNAQEPYKQGPVVEVTFVRTMPGQYANFMSYVFGDYARLMSAYKSAGIILDWAVFSTQVGHELGTRSPEEPNLIVHVTYPDMATLDSLAEKTRPIIQRVLGKTSEQTRVASLEREQMRVVLGSQLYRMVVPR